MASALAADICALVSNAWSWWWDAKNRADELWRSILTFMVAMTIVFSYATTVKKRRRRDGQPGPPPGPRGLPLLGSLPFLRRDVHRQFTELAREYGPIFGLRLGSKQWVVVTSASLAKEVLRDHDATFANRDMPVASRVASRGGLDVAWGQLDDPHWRPVRKLCTRELLNGASVDALRGMRRMEVRRTVGELYGKAGARVNVGEVAFMCAVNVIMSALWGGARLLEGELREKMGELMDLSVKPNVSDFFPVLAGLDLQGIERQMKRLMGWFDGMFDAIIKERLRVMRGKKREGASGDFLETLLRTRESGSSEIELTMDHIKGLFLDG
ncbi:Geraniol 8-hydroxylase [Acorus calamus]|uniref:Geraniol 8-hydroxylase n=1 Tax=Acorus calamus TaxID=4465 RepID=A0AAV9DU09_ACOCL|nr:Geraniol 8-hydroxylase [Acorus calamus]